MMTLTQYKKVIKSLTRDELEAHELEAHLFEMFKSSKVFKDIESSCWSVESNDELIASLQKRLEKVFWKEQFSLSECKGVLNDYLSRTVDEGTKALMHLAFAAEAAELSAVYGDYGGRFYNSLESSAGIMQNCIRISSASTKQNSKISYLLPILWGMAYQMIWDI